MQEKSKEEETTQKCSDLEVAQLKKTLTEKDELVSKLKQLALKSKKELQETKSKVHAFDIKIYVCKLECLYCLNAENNVCLS